MSADNSILVVVRRHQEFFWFRSETDYWVLDDRKWGEAYLAAGYGGDPTNSDHRFGISVVDQGTADLFISKMSEFRVELGVLREEFLLMIGEADDWFDIAEFLPAVFVDFDSRKLWSIHGEPPSLEEYVPDGWGGVVEDFFGELPADVSYWVIDGESSLLRFFSA